MVGWGIPEPAKRDLLLLAKRLFVTFDQAEFSVAWIGAVLARYTPRTQCRYQIRISWQDYGRECETKELSRSLNILAEFLHSHQPMRLHRGPNGAVKRLVCTKVFGCVRPGVRPTFGARIRSYRPRRPFCNPKG